MPIYSRNRINESVVPAENYTDRDFGRIMYETALNDQKVFNAVLANEFKEQAAMSNGTMLESELRSFQEFSVKEAWKGLKEKVKKLWEKIKAVFRSVFAKLTVWFVKSGKGFVKLHRKNILGKDISKCEIPKYRKPTANYSTKAPDAAEKAGMDFDKAIEQKNTKDASDVAKELLGAAIGTDSVDVGDFAEKYMDYVFGAEQEGKEWAQLDSVGLTEMFSSIENGSKDVKALKKAEKAADKRLSELVKKLDKKANGKFEGENKTDSDGRTSETYSNASKYVSGFQTFITTLCSAQIKAVKFNIKQNRQVIGKLAGYTATKESALMEACAWFEGAEDVAEMDEYHDPEAMLHEPEVAEEIAADPELVEININVDAE